jgi:hypothetical protein
VEGLRRGLGAGAPFGRVREGPVRWRGRAREEGPGGESAVGGGEAMAVDVVDVLCAGARWCGLLVWRRFMLVVKRNLRGRRWLCRNLIDW